MGLETYDCALCGRNGVVEIWIYRCDRCGSHICDKCLSKIPKKYIEKDEDEGTHILKCSNCIERYKIRKLIKKIILAHEENTKLIKEMKEIFKIHVITK